MSALALAVAEYRGRFFVFGLSTDNPSTTDLTKVGVCGMFGSLVRKWVCVDNIVVHRLYPTIWQGEDQKDGCSNLAAHPCYLEVKQ